MADLIRELTAGELREARWMYGANINFATVRIHRGKWFPFQPDDTAMAPNGHVYFPPPIYHADFSTGPDMWLLIHELCHVWQVQSGVWLKFRRVVIEGGDYDYGELSLEADLKEFKLEQQASIVADWYRLRHDKRPLHGSGGLKTYEQVIRRAIPTGQP